jgi:hypothetical protein
MLGLFSAGAGCAPTDDGLDNQPPACAPAMCDDHNPCTADSCGADGRCVSTPVASGTACSDGNVCNGAETCTGGTCTAGSAPAIDDGNACTADSCDPSAGVTHRSVADGTSCADSNLCNGSETCRTGACAAGNAPAVDDGNPCTADSCDPAAGVRHTGVTDGTSCADDDVCDGSEICQQGTCRAGIAPAVDDNNPCTADSCNPATGVAHTPSPDGTSCADGNMCNGAESCHAGMCTGTAPGVDDNNPCTADSCNPATGVAHTPVADGTSCADANMCNGAETCTAGVCGAGAPVTCCLTQSCNPGSGACEGPCEDLCTMAPVNSWSYQPMDTVVLAVDGWATTKPGRHFLAGGYHDSSLSFGGDCPALPPSWSYGQPIYLAAFEGGTCRWAKSFLAAQPYPEPRSIAVLGTGEVVMLGMFSGSLDLKVPNPNQDGVPNNGDEWLPPMTAGYFDGKGWFIAVFDAATGATKMVRQYNLGARSFLMRAAADPRTTAAGNGEFLVTAILNEADAATASLNPFDCPGPVPTPGGKGDGVLLRFSTVGGTRIDPGSGLAVPAPRCLWQRRSTGDGDESAQVLAVDSDGDIAVAGSYSSGTTPTSLFGGPTLPSAASGAYNSFLVKLAGEPPTHQWSRSFTGQSSADRAYPTSIGFAHNGDVVFGGYLTGEVDLGLTSKLKSNGSADALVGKLDGRSGSTGWAKRAGVAGSEEVYAVLPNGDEVIAGGQFRATINFGDTSAHNLVLQNPYDLADVFLVSLRLSDGRAVYSKRAGDTAYQELFGLARLPGGMLGLGRLQGTLNFGSTAATAITEPRPQQGYAVWLQRFVTDGQGPSCAAP